ncbi:MAG: TPM domain-containing protein [Syntrophothermus sp.]
MAEKLIHKYFDDDELLRISNTIKKYEMQTSGEIAVSVKEHSSISEKKKSIEELAKQEFVKLGIHNTKDKTGILIFILLDKKQFHILADSGINEKVQQDTWDKIKDIIESKFREGSYAEGLIYGVEEVGKILAEHFPIKPDDVNELSNIINF